MNALSMITKAGVPARKIMVGIASYGRSYKMTDSGCRTELCTFEGPESRAAPGMCTGTNGYIANAEINDILLEEPCRIKTWSDEKTDSDYLVYSGTEWVAYMSSSLKESRANKYKALNLGGVSDWAVDFAEYHAVSRPADAQEDTDGLDEADEWCKGQHSNLDDIPENLSPTCGAVYVLQALGSMLDADLKNYTHILANGYDGKFKTYADAVVQSAPNTIRDFYMHNGTKYFSCVVAEGQLCCSQCSDRYGDLPGHGQCRYCSGSLCQGMGYAYLNVSEPCPPEFSLRASQNEVQRQSDTIYWTLRPDQADQFYADLEADTGIAKENVGWGAVNHVPTGCYEYPRCYNNGWDFGVPKIVSGYNASDVANPKDTIVSAAEAVKMNSAITSANDYVDAFALPVLMVHAAVENMASVMQIADKVDEEKRKALIWMLISAFLFLVPISGEAIGAIASLSNDPSTAPFAIFGFILSDGVFREADELRRAANARRAMRGEDVAKLGKGVAEGLGKIGKVVASACMLAEDLAWSKMTANPRRQADFGALRVGEIATSQESKTEPNRRAPLRINGRHSYDRCSPNNRKMAFNAIGKGYSSDPGRRDPAPGR
ncbi:uncharacterized protein B0T15DRAFT_562882 [Chaetomium strumarium]|uniref:GH18 domain-containing protein n=1 Tax=Chaetomium strumarium TaxID=1170767 RepID=A0AAJ0GMP8_9PEZI|nr:hypothetical protein B0T15DRAFT_562882 [Chaetomium strumarium]